MPGSIFTAAGSSVASFVGNSAWIATASGGLRHGGDTRWSGVASYDSFTDSVGTDLLVHTPDTGGAWIDHPVLSGDAVITSAGRCRHNSNAGSVWLLNSQPTAAAYSVSCDIYAWSFLFYEYGTGVVANFDATAASGYSALYNPKGKLWTLSRWDSGSQTILGSYAQTISLLTTYRLALNVSNGSVSLSVNGTVRVTANDSTYSSGSVGILFALGFSPVPTDTTGVHLDNWTLSAPGSFASYAPLAAGGTNLGGSTATAIIKRASFSAAGGSSASFSGSRVASAVFAMAGGSSFTALANAIRTSSFTATGGSTASFTGSKIVSAAFTMAGVSSAAFSGTQVRVGAFAMAGGSTAVFTTDAAFTMAGSSTAAFVGSYGTTPSSSAFTCYGNSTATFDAVVSWSPLGSPAGGSRFSGHAAATGLSNVVPSGGMLLGGQYQAAGLVYNIYANDGQGSPVSYVRTVFSTTGLTWTTTSLAYPGDYTWHVRVMDIGTGFEEHNVDARVELILDGSGIDITKMPVAPIALMAEVLRGGTVRLRWNYRTPAGKYKPSEFHVYSGTPTVNYGSRAATIAYRADSPYRIDLNGFTDGAPYQFVVRAFNLVAEEPNTNIVTATPEATGPLPPQGITGVPD